MAGLEQASDSLLVDRAVDGDVRAFETLVARHLGLMRAYAWRLTGSQADASDAVQNALITIWEQLPRLEDGSVAKSWMMRIVSRKSIDLIRARKPADDVDDMEHPPAHDPGPLDAATTSGAMKALSEALGRLPESQRQCWVLKEVGGESYGEIAEHLGITVTAVRGKLARARESLVVAMEGWR